MGVARLLGREYAMGRGPAPVGVLGELLRLLLPLLLLLHIDAADLTPSRPTGGGGGGGASAVRASGGRSRIRSIMRTKRSA